MWREATDGHANRSRALAASSPFNSTMGAGIMRKREGGAKAFFCFGRMRQHERRLIRLTPIASATPPTHAPTAIPMSSPSV